LKVNHLATLVYATSSSETLLPLLKNWTSVICE
jgi:hypothetical protein